jgi:hypothetical protein
MPHHAVHHQYPGVYGHSQAPVSLNTPPCQPRYIPRQSMYRWRSSACRYNDFQVLEVDLQGRVARLAADTAAPSTDNSSREAEELPVDDQVSSASHARLVASSRLGHRHSPTNTPLHAVPVLCQDVCQAAAPFTCPPYAASEVVTWPYCT